MIALPAAQVSSVVKFTNRPGLLSCALAAIGESSTETASNIFKINSRICVLQRNWGNISQNECVEMTWINLWQFSSQELINHCWLDASLPRKVAFLTCTKGGLVPQTVSSLAPRFR